MNAPVLSEMQKDALTELFNIGIGQAASTLSEMIHEDVELSVPNVQCLTLLEASENIVNSPETNLSAVKQNFQGDFSGNALLIFPVGDSLELVRRMIGEEVPLEQLSDLEEDALLEVGNVILNACIYSISEVLGCALSSTMPLHSQGTCINVLTEDGALESSFVLHLSMSFAIPGHNVNGAIGFIMNMISMSEFIGMIDSYINNALSKL